MRARPFNDRALVFLSGKRYEYRDRRSGVMYESDRISESTDTGYSFDRSYGFGGGFRARPSRPVAGCFPRLHDSRRRVHDRTLVAPRTGRGFAGRRAGDADRCVGLPFGISRGGGFGRRIRRCRAGSPRAAGCSDRCRRNTGRGDGLLPVLRLFVPSPTGRQERTGT